MIKAGFIAGESLSSIDELYAEMAITSNDYGSTIDELYAEVAMGSPEWGSTIDELFVELAYLGNAIAVSNRTLDFSKPENSQYIALAFQDI